MPVKICMSDLKVDFEYASSNFVSGDAPISKRGIEELFNCLHAS
jgi:hypothetical protein